MEGQKTGEEKHGGLQIEIIPELQPKLRVWRRDSSFIDDPYNFRGASSLDCLPEHKTPQSLCMTPGVKLRSYPCPGFKERVCLVSDVVEGGVQQASLSVNNQPIIMANSANHIIRPYTHCQ